jgi:glycosyltransferase involved in cell wall biosynthesis
MIIDRYHPIWGGAENQLAGLAEKLPTHEVRVTILTRRWNPDLAKKDSLNGVSVLRTGIPGPPGLWTNLCYVVGVLIQLLRHRKDIDVIHTHGAVLLGGLGKMAGILLRKPNVVKIATAGKIDKIQKTWWGFIPMFFLRRSTRVVALSGEIESELRDAGVPSASIVRIPNGVDVHRFAPLAPADRKRARSEHGLRDEDPVVLFSGRFVRRKGLDLLMEAWRNLYHRHPGARLWVLGNGSHQPDSVEEEIKQQVETLKLPRVVWLDASPLPERYLQCADVFAFPSRREGLSNTLLEAMACGVPPVASDIGGNTDVVIHQRNGYLFPSGDAEQLAQQLDRLLSEPAERKRLSLSARADMLAAYRMEEVSNRYTQVYRELLPPPEEGAGVRRPERKSLLRRIQTVSLVLVVVLFTVYLWRERDQVAATLSQIDPKILPLVIGMLVGLNVFKASAWTMFARSMPDVVMPRRLLAGAWMTSLLGKYLPGSVWDMFSRLVIMARHGVSKTRAGFTIGMEQIYTVIVSLLLVLITPQFQQRIGSVWIPLLLAGGMAAFALFPVGLSLLGVLLRKLRPFTGAMGLPSFPSRAIYFAACGASRILAGGVLVAMLRMFRVDVPTGDLLYLSAILSLSFTSGYLLMITPGGIGVREGILTFFLTDFVPAPTALALAFSLRIWSFFADILTFWIGRGLMLTPGKEE